MGDHFPTFTRIKDTAANGVRAAGATFRFTERVALRLTFYVIIALCLTSHLIYQIPPLFEMIGGRGYGGPYYPGGWDNDSPIWAWPIRFIISLVGPPPVPAIVGFLSLIVLVFTSRDEPRRPRLRIEDLPRSTVTAGPLQEEAPPSPRPTAPPERHPLDPDPSDPPLGPLWPRK